MHRRSLCGIQKAATKKMSTNSVEKILRLSKLEFVGRNIVNEKNSHHVTAAGPIILKKISVPWLFQGYCGRQAEN